MRVGIIGGGLMGVALAYFLADSGEAVTVLEQGSDLGGLNGELQFGDDLTVARYQHAIMPNDRSAHALCAELGLTNELVFQEAHTGFVYNSNIHPMTNIRDFLSFSVLSITDRVRLGQMILRARAIRDWHKLDDVPAKDWLIDVGGRDTFQQIWRPLLEAKFDGVYEDVSATYIWAWLNRMSSIRHGAQLQGRVGYLRRGHYSLIESLAKQLHSRGGKVELQVRVREIDVSSGSTQRVRTHTGNMEFDILIAAIATPTFSLLIPGAEASYREQLSKSKYLGLICPVLVLNKPLSKYWTLNITDPNVPFSTIIETPHPTHPEYHVVHLPRYTAPDNDWMGVPDEDIRNAWFSHLKTIFPDFADEQVKYFAVSRSRYVEPIYRVRSLDHIPAVETPYDGLYLANTAQVYPELPTSEAVIAHARRIASIVKLKSSNHINVTSSPRQD